MTRWWTELVAAISDVIPLNYLVLFMFLVAALVGALWYWFPAWVPRRWPRLRRPRFRLRWPSWRGMRWRLRWRWPEWARPRWLWRWLRRKRKPEQEPVPDLEEVLTSDELPDLPAEAFLALADRLALEGRYAEALRERLRAIVRQLVDHGVIEHRPGWTITELAAGAASALPAVAAPLDAAAGLFSEIWYGQRPANASHDGQMRGYAEAVGQLLARPRSPVGAVT
jgi:Domain of unknown function (DUF4129)